MIDIIKILDLLPHRYPLLLVDRVLEVNVGESLRALKNVTINEPFFQGHFPGKPIMPGVLIIESLAQACSLLALQDDKYLQLVKAGGVMLFAGIDKAKFKRPVVPGDTLILDVKLLRARPDKFYASYETHALVNEETAAVATLNVMCSPATIG